MACSEPIIKVVDIAYVRFRAPDLDRMESFLSDFGMRRSARTDELLCMRGTGPDHTVHLTERGEPGFAGLAFEAACADDLQALAAATGAPVETRTEPGGGSRVRLTDPNGFLVEVVAGMETLAPQPGHAGTPFNAAETKNRLGQPVRLKQGPSHVLRLGHCVINVIDYPASADWYHRHFGLIKSDEIFIGDQSTVFGAFLRCDCGDRPVDHHTLFLVGTGTPAFNHAAWEVDGFDDLMLGHQELKTKGHTPVWGVGRHILGSQIFDYWKDPWGHKVEHWTDGDLFTAAEPPHLASVDTLIGTQWGDTAPPDMA